MLQAKQIEPNELLQALESCVRDVRYLIRNPNCQDEDIFSELYRLRQARLIPALDQLRSWGRAWRDQQTGNNLFHLAAKYGTASALYALESDGIDINLKNNDGDTPLHIAVRGRHVEVVEFLVRRKAFPDIENTERETPMGIGRNIADRVIRDRIFIALGSVHHPLALLRKLHTSHFRDGERKERVESALRKWGVEWKNKETGSTLFHLLVNDSHRFSHHLLAASTAKLQELGMDINVGDKKGNTPLHHAARYGAHNLCRVFIAHGADKEAINNKGRTPLLVAARSEQGGQNVQVLLDSGADISACDDEGNTALHLAARCGHRVHARILVGRGAKTNVKNGKGCTPLYLAAMEGHTSIVEDFIRQYAADIYVKSCNGRTILHAAVIGGKAGMCSFLLKVESNLNAQDNKGNTPLHLSMRKEKTYVASCLLDNGVDVNACNHEGNTALHLAVQDGREDMVTLLLRKGADAGIRNKKELSAEDLIADNKDLKKRQRLEEIFAEYPGTRKEIGGRSLCPAFGEPVLS